MVITPSEDEGDADAVTHAVPLYRSHVPALFQVPVVALRKSPTDWAFDCKLPINKNKANAINSEKKVLLLLQIKHPGKLLFGLRVNVFMLVSLINQ